MGIHRDVFSAALATALLAGLIAVMLVIVNPVR